VDAPLVTIVTPSLNQGRFVRATIESVLSQNYPHVEYLIMDGGSTDETAVIAGEYASRLTFLSAPDTGQSNAINKGFRRAHGQIVAWLNSDDVLLEGAVAKAVAALDARPEAAAVYGEGYRIDEAGNTLGRFPYTEPFNLWKLVNLYDFVLQQSLFMRRQAVAGAGYLDESLHYTMDWDLLIRLGKRYPIDYIPEPMAAIREHATAKSFAGGGERVREIGRMLRIHTGERFAPGFVLYALETWRRWWSAPVTGRIVEKLREESQGLSRDRWAGSRMLYMVPPGVDPILIRGLSPAPQQLRIECNGSPVGEHTVGAGAFDIPVAEPTLATLEILATPPDGRASKKSWVVRSIKRRPTEER
jgi:glycosyl transferase family 2